jgi:hypothetical protein
MMKVFLKENYEEVLFHGICKSSNVSDSPDADANSNADANPNAVIGTTASANDAKPGSQ